MAMLSQGTQGFTDAPERVLRTTTQPPGPIAGADHARIEQGVRARKRSQKKIVVRENSKGCVEATGFKQAPAMEDALMMKVLAPKEPPRRVRPGLPHDCHLGAVGVEKSNPSVDDRNRGTR